MREEAIYLMARAMLMEMLGAEQPRPQLRLVGDNDPSPTSEQGVKKQRWSPLKQRKMAANS